LFALSISSAASAMTPVPAELSGVFLKEPADALSDLGVQLVFTIRGRGAHVILRCGKGSLSGVPEVVAARIHRGALTFSLREGGDSRCPVGDYEGRFHVVDGVATTLALHPPSDGAALVLRRESGFAPAGVFYPFE
jgi:hypothetical protein